jgi:hypothetical protein
MIDGSIGPREGLVDVSKYSLRDLDGVDDEQRERAIRAAFDRVTVNGDAMSSDSRQREFSDET